MIIEIPLKGCCGETTGRLAGDECDCLAFAAEAAARFQTPIIFVTGSTRALGDQAAKPTSVTDVAPPSWVAPGALVLYGPHSVVRQGARR